MERVVFPSIMSSFPAAAGAIEAGFCGRSGQSPTEMVDGHHNENTFPPEARDLPYSWIAPSFLLCHLLGCQTPSVLWVAK